MDVGCGAGIFIGACKRFGKFVVSIDVNREQLSHAVNYGKGLLVSADASYLPFKDSSMDGVFFSHVIEHLENPFPIFGEIRRVLKKGGVLVVITPTEHKHFYTLGHVRAYTKKTLSEILLKAGFFNVYTVYGSSFLLGIKDSEFLKEFIKMMPIRWFKEILIAKAINQKI